MSLKSLRVHLNSYIKERIKPLQGEDNYQNGGFHNINGDYGCFTSNSRIAVSTKTTMNVQ